MNLSPQGKTNGISGVSDRYLSRTVNSWWFWSFGQSVRAMKSHSQLTRLLLSFYREEPIQLQQLRPIEQCKVSRRWGTLRIDCHTPQVAETLIQANDLLREPIAQLRLAHHVSILVRGNHIATLPIDSSKLHK
jgi:hypothetical protein